MKPTPKQVAFLRQLGIQTPPKNKALCSRLLSFILEGNGANTGQRASNQYERVALFLMVREKYEGKKALKFGEQEVMIKNVFPKTREEVADNRRFKIEGVLINPFSVTYDYVDSKGEQHTTHSSLGNLTLIS